MNCKCRRYHGALEEAAKMSTVAYRARLLPAEGKPRCWHAALALLGVTVPHEDRGRTAMWIKDRVLEAGRQVELVVPSDLVPEAKAGNLTLAVVMPHVLTGSWLLFTKGHVIGVRDGIVADTMGLGETVKRRVEFAYRLKSNGPVAPVKCGCLDPVVFGHAAGHRQPLRRHDQL
jgi:hypothetical protein